MAVVEGVDGALQSALSGRYAVVRSIGRGGMGTVYLARDEARDRYVALKVLHPELAAEVSGARFRREVSLLERLEHPLVVSVLESDTSGPFAWFAMPLIQGESLRDRLRREERLRFVDIQAIVTDVAEGLDHVHRAGIVHRDLKPENVLLAGGRALVADFGIARIFDDGGALEAGPTMTRAGQVLGTPAYMSPEQVGGQKVDPRSDVYSLGVMVYEMLVGLPPFRAPTAVQLMSQHLTEPPVPPRQRLEDIPLSMESAVLRALSKEPLHRFESAGDFARALALAEPGPDAPRATTRPVVAVLDFVNVTQAPALEWLGTGLAETLSAELARMEGVRIVPRDRLAKVCPRPPALTDEEAAQSAARSLGARWVVWGSFQGLGNRLRIHHRLADTATGTVRGPEVVEGSLEEVFLLQDTVLDRVRRALAVETPTATVTGILRQAPGALTAYEHYIRGLQNFRQFGPRGFAEAWEHFERAVRVDPRHAPALAGMGAISCFRFVGSTNPADLTKAIELLERALAVDPQLAEAHLWLGYANMRLGKFDEATVFGRRAAELDPANSFAHYIHGVSMMVHGMEGHRWERFAPAIPALVRAIQLDPSDSASYFGLADTYLQAGHPELAEPLLQRAVVLERSGGTGGKVRLPGGRALLGSARRRLGRLAEARAVLQEAASAYEADEHLYAATFTALARCELGTVAELEGKPEEALGHYLLAGALCEARRERLGTRQFWIRARLGQARIRHRLGERDAARLLAEARNALEPGAEGLPRWVWEGSDALVQFELAHTEAALGEADEARRTLSRAVDAGWGDLPSLRQLPALESAIGPEALAALRSLIESRGSLPDYPSDLLTDTESALARPGG